MERKEPLGITDGDDYLKVGDLARKTGKTVRAIHLLEELGLLRPAARSSGGYRLYRDDAMKRVEWITRLQGMGFTLHEVRSFLRSYEENPSAHDAMRQVREIFQAKLSETEAHITRLSHLVVDLRQSLTYLESCHPCGVAELPTCVGCDRYGHDGTAPLLVEGLQHKKN